MYSPSRIWRIVSAIAWNALAMLPARAVLSFRKAAASPPACFQLMPSSSRLTS